MPRAIIMLSIILAIIALPVQLPLEHAADEPGESVAVGPSTIL